MKGKMKLSMAFVILIALVLTLSFSVSYVNSILVNDVILSSPSDGDWFNGTNTTNDFVFYFNSTANTTADCTIYINASVGDSPQFTISDGWLRNTTNIARNTTTTMNLNWTTPDDLYNWTVFCTNTTGWNPEPIDFYVDTVTPSLLISSVSFTNLSTSNNANPWIYLVVNDTDAAYGGPYLVQILNLSNNAVLASSYLVNATYTNFSLTTVASAYENLWVNFSIRATDNASNNNDSVGWAEYRVFIDTTDPVITFVSPTADDDNLTTFNYTYINATVVDDNFNNATIHVNGTTFNPIGWQSWDILSNARSDAGADDGSWVTLVNSNTTAPLLSENYTAYDITGGATDLSSISRIEYLFMYNLTSGSEINISFWNYTASGWSNMYSNNTASNGPINETISTTLGTEFIGTGANAQFQVRINLSNTAGNNLTGSFYEGQARFYTNRCSGSGSSRYCFWNYTQINDDNAQASVNFWVWANDTSGNFDNTTARTMYVDYTSPAIGSYSFVNVTGGTNMYIAVNLTSITESNLDSCWARIYALGNTSLTATRVEGSTAGNSYCNFNVTFSDIPGIGTFTMEPYLNDSAGATLTGTNQSNWTMTTLYEGWNLIQIDRNTTLRNITQYLQSGIISRASLYDNVLHSYTHYLTSASANATKAVIDGDPVYVYANQTSYLMRGWTTDAGFYRYQNITTGWNQLANFDLADQQLGTLAAQSIINESTEVQVVFYATDYDADSGLYYNHRRTFSLYANRTISKGEAYWFKINGTSSTASSNITFTRDA